MKSSRLLRLALPLAFTTVGLSLGYLVKSTSAVTEATAATHGGHTPDANASPSTLPFDPNIFVNLSKKVVPSVVNISTTTTVKGGGGAARPGPEDLFHQFFEEFLHRQGGSGRRGGGGEEGADGDYDGNPPSGGGKGGVSPKAISLGSGFIIDSSGLILTNNHVVADADEIKIQFTEEADEKPTDGVVVGRDPELDLALIRVKNKRTMTPLALGDSDSLEVGEYVLAVGNPFGQGHSVTHGIISAKERPAPDFLLANYLQTDAPINPGNSGGPLINLKGEVIGINNAIDQRATGIGFAIPISLVKKVLPQLKSRGTVIRGYIGILVGEVTPEIAPKLGVNKDVRAPFINHVYPGDPADKAGMKNYDVILEFNHKIVHTATDLITAVTSVAVNDTVPVKISRGGDEKTVSIKVTARPASEKAVGETEGRKKDKLPPHPEMGLDIETLTPDMLKRIGITEKVSGVLVNDISYGSPADRAGLYRDDIILEVDRKPVKNVEEFYSAVKGDKSYLLRVRRLDGQGHETFTVVVLDLKNLEKK